MKSDIDLQLQKAQGLFTREPEEILADGDKMAPGFPNLLLLVRHSQGMCLVDLYSGTRLLRLTTLMAMGALPIGFVGMDENLDLEGLMPVREFREAEWAVDLLHEAYGERSFRVGLKRFWKKTLESIASRGLPRAFSKVRAT